VRWHVVDNLKRRDLLEPLDEAIDYLFREGLLVHDLTSGYGDSRVLRMSRLGKQVLEAAPEDYVFSDTRASELVHPRFKDALRDSKSETLPRLSGARAYRFHKRGLARRRFRRC
jgi:hypothetical protein